MSYHYVPGEPPWCVKAAPNDTHAIAAHRELDEAFDDYLTRVYPDIPPDQKENEYALPQDIHGPSDFEMVYQAFEEYFELNLKEIPPGTSFRYRYNLQYARWVTDPTNMQRASSVLIGSASSFSQYSQRELFPDLAHFAPAEYEAEAASPDAKRTRLENEGKLCRCGEPWTPGHQLNSEDVEEACCGRCPSPIF